MKSLVNSLFVLLLLSGDITAQWFHQNSGTTANLGSVFFIDVNIGWTCGTGGKIIKTTNGGLDWFDQNSNTSVGLNTIQFIDANNGWACGSNQILKTTDGGLLWSVQNFPSSTSLYTIQFVNTNIGWITSYFADTSYIQKSTNGGDTWTVQYQAQNESYGSMHFLDENTGWVTFSFGLSGVLKTTDGGSIWTQYNANFSGNPTHIWFVNNLTGWVSHNTLGSYGISKSTDGGITWFLQIQESSKFIHSINFPNSNIGYAAGWQMFIPPNPDQEFIMKSSDGGSSWFEQYRGVGVLNSIFFVNDQLGWAVGKNGTILYTPNGGLPVELKSFTASVAGNDVYLNWSTATELNNSGFEVEKSSLLPPAYQGGGGEVGGGWEKIGFVPGHGTTTETQIYSFDDKSVSSGKYQYRLKQIDYDGTFEYSDIVEVEVGLPTEFSLEQNYPNPFNPSTKIKFTIPTSPLNPSPYQGEGQRERFITLIVYDVLGNEVATLVNEEKPAGSYEVNFDATGLTSGIYFYQLKAGSFIQTKKMILLR
ncbi:MAG: T9SS type A sorting domain-containing protein [Bacteroidetes bacterium]|nr:T9SS type A sorting domain-containing protein [Bacteroidota bacterium]